MWTSCTRFGGESLKEKNETEGGEGEWGSGMLRGGQVHEYGVLNVVCQRSEWAWQKQMKCSPGEEEEGEGREGWNRSEGGKSSEVSGTDVALCFTHKPHALPYRWADYGDHFPCDHSDLTQSLASVRMDEIMTTKDWGRDTVKDIETARESKRIKKKEPVLTT